jgi:hypothetical protein
MASLNPMQEAFSYVREIYRNCSRILLNADLLMEERGFLKYGWAHHHYPWYPDNNLAWTSKTINCLSDADKLLTGYLFHQYYEKDKKDKDIVTICTAPWRRGNENEFTPACCVTRFEATSVPDDVYWIGAMPIWERKNRTDGVIVKYDYNKVKEMTLLRNQDLEKYNKLVFSDSAFTSVSIPLLDVVSSEDINNRLIKVLLGN